MGQLTRHSRVRGQNVSCAHAVVSHLAGLPVFFMKMYRRCLVSLSNFVIVLINWLQDFVSSNSVCNYSRD